MAKRPDALNGTIDLLVLRVLERGPAHGYAIASHIASASDDLLRVEEGSLYPALRRMEHEGLIRATWQVTAANRRARVYSLTARGRTQLDEEKVRWQRLARGVASVLRWA